MGAIDVGSDAVDRAEIWQVSTYTLLNKGNVANDTGNITSVEIWVNENTTGTIVATFFGSGTDWTSRGSATIGAVTAGSKQTFSGLSFAVETGDIIGMYVGSAGKMEIGSPNDAGMLYLSGDQIDEVQHTYTDYGAVRAISLYGIGVTTGWSNIASVNGSASGDIAKVKGVAVADVAKVNGVAV